MGGSVPLLLRLAAVTGLLTALLICVVTQGRRYLGSHLFLRSVTVVQIERHLRHHASGGPGDM